MNRARAFVNDAFRGGAGRILTDTAPFTIEYLNAALEELQDKIGNNGVITLIKDNVILTPITALPGPNPQTQIFVGYNGFFNGTAMVKLPVLPSDVRAILRVWETETGSRLPFKEMTEPNDGLPSILQGPWLNFWEYRGDALYMTGSTQTEDLRIRYESRQLSLADDADFADTEIQILSSVNALATLVAYAYARARGAAAAQLMQADAQQQMRYIVRRYTRRAQRKPINRRPYGEGGDRRGVRLPF